MLLKEILLAQKRAWDLWVEEKMGGSLWQFFLQGTAVPKGWEADAVKVVLERSEKYRRKGSANL